MKLWAVGLACFAAGAVLVALLRAPASTTRRAAPVPPASAAEPAPVPVADLGSLRDDLMAIHAVLERIDGRLAGLEGRGLPVAAGEPSARVPLGEEAERTVEVVRLVEALEGLRGVVDLRFGELQSALDGGGRSLGQRKAEKPETDWGELGLFLDAWIADEKVAKRDLQLLSDEDVLSRFGPPTNVWSNDGGVIWQYGQNWDPAANKYQLEIGLRLRDGYVTNVWVER